MAILVLYAVGPRPTTHCIESDITHVGNTLIVCCAVSREHD